MKLMKRIFILFLLSFSAIDAFSQKDMMAIPVGKKPMDFLKLYGNLIETEIFSSVHKNVILVFDF